MSPWIPGCLKADNYKFLLFQVGHLCVPRWDWEVNIMTTTLIFVLIAV